MTAQLANGDYSQTDEKHCGRYSFIEVKQCIRNQHELYKLKRLLNFVKNCLGKFGSLDYVCCFQQGDNFIMTIFHSGIFKVEQTTGTDIIEHAAPLLGESLIFHMMDNDSNSVNSSCSDAASYFAGSSV